MQVVVGLRCVREGKTMTVMVWNRTALLCHEIQFLSRGCVFSYRFSQTDWGVWRVWAASRHWRLAGKVLQWVAIHKTGRLYRLHRL